MKILLMSLFFSIPAFLFGQSKAKGDSFSVKLLAKTIKAHGGKKYNKAHYQFTFRDHLYRFKNSKKGYEYTVRKSKGGQQVFDQLVNGNLVRTINGQETELNAKAKQGAVNSLNSVIYFATLPHKLSDPAVNLTYGKTTKIKGQEYHVLHVQFDKVGGGVDHDDEFVYWIRTDNYRIDYLAYNYQVGKGGVRFREANNTREVGGILFQDYVNYKAEVGTALTDLPELFEKGKLKKLSEINTEKVSKIK